VKKVIFEMMFRIQFLIITWTVAEVYTPTNAISFRRRCLPTTKRCAPSRPVPVPGPVPIPAVPKPRPVPLPIPVPVRIPAPVPVPISKPVPRTVPVPIPVRVPIPVPIPVPVPLPASIPRQVPLPIPIPVPIPVPLTVPITNPAPKPVPVLVPAPIPRPVTLPIPILPAPIPVPAPVSDASSYNILLNLVGVPAVDQPFFKNATMRWESIVVGELSNVSTSSLRAPLPGCAYPTIIDDLYICATFASIDGPLQVLGYASPLYIRASSRLTITGEMAFDIDDISYLKAQGNFGSVILHEIGHVLGM
jgi:hypothetical protein